MEFIVLTPSAYAEMGVDCFIDVRVVRDTDDGGVKILAAFFGYGFGLFFG